MSKIFSCDRCGACCRLIRMSKFYSEDLDRGDGVCKHLSTDNLCEIYPQRPIFCNVDAYYEKFLSESLTKEKYYRMNHLICDKLKEIDRKS